MRRIKALALLTALTAVIAGTTTQASAAPAPEPKLSTLRVNTFERPAKGTAYTLAQWRADGWTAGWAEGMDTRSWIDGDNFRHSGTKSLRIFYPKGKIGPADSGAQIPLDLNPSREYYVSQWVRFSSGFSWGTTQFAGKVGVGLAGGKACSGGVPCDGYNGFTSRLIWRSSGQAAIYYYSLNHAGEYGDYVNLTDASGSGIKWPRGKWVNVVQRVRVNTVTNGTANPDGQIQVWFNGVSAANISGLRFVRNGDLVDRAYFSSFAGGATTDFAPANDSWIWYDDLKVSTRRSDICELSSC
ncbi:polysaccharide lyase [Kribbella sp. CA-294648]|uniref:polysaccharide lyase n=1 Tax=Kribbella sp. CA-294648 TaxID=3239948 RepID=UPI003D93963A